MGKIKLPDEIEKWEKKSLREDIGSEKEHTHTIYVYKNIAIEHEHDCGCDAWNPYVLVDGHPFKLHGDYFHNFDEALGYIKGALKEKKLLDEEPDDDDDEPEEPEFPKAEANDMSKSFVMPTAREMFAEAHALPDMYELAKSREIHKQQMREFFDAQKAATYNKKETEAKDKDYPPSRSGTDVDDHKSEQTASDINESARYRDITGAAEWGGVHVNNSPSAGGAMQNIPENSKVSRKQSGNVAGDRQQKGKGSSLGRIGKHTSSDATTRTQEEKDAYDEAAAEAKEKGTAQPERKGRMAMGTYNDRGVSRDLGNGHTHFTEAMLGVDPPQDGDKMKGIYGLITDYNRRLRDAPNDIKGKLGISNPLPYNVGGLTTAQLIQLLASGYKTKDPLSGKYTMKPEYEEQLEIPAGFDLSKPIFLDGRKRINLDALANFQMSDPDSATHTPINRNAYTDLIHLTNGWDPTSMRGPIADDRLGDEFDNAVTRATDKEAEGYNPNAIKQFAYGDITIDQLDKLVNILGTRDGIRYTPNQLNSLMGFDFGAYDQGVPQKQAEDEGAVPAQEELTDIEGNPNWLVKTPKGVSPMDMLRNRLDYLGKIPFSKDQYSAIINGDKAAISQMYQPGGPLAGVKGNPALMNYVIKQAFSNPRYHTWKGDETVNPDTGVKTYGNGNYWINPMNDKFQMTTYDYLMPDRIKNIYSTQKSFREIMEERIQKADAEAGIPSGYIGMHPHKAAYKTVWLGYGKDATYPFVLKNALTGEKVCEVSDIPRDERKD